LKARKGSTTKSYTKPSNRVSSIKPLQAQLPKGSTVTLDIFEKWIKVPNVIGLSKESAEQKLHKYGIKIKSYTVKHSDKDTGIILNCNPSELKPGESTNLTISQKTPSGMIFVQGGSFKRFSIKKNTHEKLIHKVTIDDFYIGKYEVSHKEYIKFLNTLGITSNGIYNVSKYINLDNKDATIDYYNGNFFFEGSSYASSPDCPVVNVTWHGADAYCRWKGGRLPTEAEWEYAAKGGRESNDYIFSGSNSLEQVAWYCDNSKDKTHPVGQKQPNELGIYDMSGNVWEWCNDRYDDDYYSSSPISNPQGPENGYKNVNRGGSCLGAGFFCSISYRGGSYGSYLRRGFRFAKTAE